VPDLVFIDGAAAGFNVGHHLPGHVGTIDLQPGCQLLLGQPQPGAKLGDVLADLIGLSLHVAPPFPEPLTG